jgi:hypothetical protein
MNYQPQDVPVLATAPTPIGIQVVRHSCFGAGTPVRTLDTPRNIEQFRSSDLVLTQAPTSSELNYPPLVAVFHNPPNATLMIELERAPRDT